MNLDIKASIEEINKMYKETVGEDDTLGALISGDPGVGKTTMAGTAPKPILVYMFDPKGHLVLRPLIEKGEVLVVPLWMDQSQDPTIWEKFNEMSTDHMDSGFIKQFSTVVIDSLSFCLITVANYVAAIQAPAADMKGPKDRPRNIPFIGDYRFIYQNIMDKIQEFSSHPINLIMTSHVTTEENELTKEIKVKLLAYGKLKNWIPPMFTEKYMLITKPGEKNPDGSVKRMVLTQPKGKYECSSQLGLPPEIEPDFRVIMKKAGFNVKDKALLK